MKPCARIGVMLSLMIVLMPLALSAAEEKAAATGTGAVDQVFGGAKPQMFQPMAVDPALVRQSMQARAEYEDLNRKIQARQAKLYEENATVKDLQAKMRELQKKVDEIMAADVELKNLKAKYHSITPELPTGMKRDVPAAPAAAAPSKKP